MGEGRLDPPGERKRRESDGAGRTGSDLELRVVVLVTDPVHAAAVAEVHGEVFRDIRPAATLVVVAALIEPGLLVEIEVDAVRSKVRR